MRLERRNQDITISKHELSSEPRRIRQDPWQYFNLYLNALPEERQKLSRETRTQMEAINKGLTPTERLGGFLYGIYPENVQTVLSRTPEDVAALQIRQEEETKSAEAHAIRHLAVHRHGDRLRQHSLGQIRHDIVLHLADHPKEKLTVEIVEIVVKEAVQTALVTVVL